MTRSDLLRYGNIIRAILILSHILITNYDDAVESKQTNLGLGMDYVAKILMANKVDTF